MYHAQAFINRIIIEKALNVTLVEQCNKGNHWHLLPMIFKESMWKNERIARRQKPNRTTTV